MERSCWSDNVADRYNFYGNVVVKMKKILIGIILIAVVLCFFFFRPVERPFDEAAFRDLVIRTARQRVEADFVPDIVIDDFPASAWLFAKKYGYDVVDIPVEYDSVLEAAEGKKEGTMKIYLDNKLYELPFPNKIVSRTHYSFYTICPLEVSLYYNEKKSLVEWAGVFKDISVIAGSADGRELFGVNGNTRIKYTMDGDNVSEVEVTFCSQHRNKIKSVKKEVMDAILLMKPIRAGDWLLRAQWNVPNEWVDERVNFEEITRVYLNDFSWTFSVPLLKGEIVLWNGCFVEGALYFTYDSWKQVKDIENWFRDVQFSSSRNGDIVEVKISDDLMKDIFSYLGLINSGFNDKLRETYLERMGKND